MHKLIFALGILLPLCAQARLDAPDVRLVEALSLEADVDFASLGEGDLLVLDLDNTVFRETQMLGTDEWYAHEVRKLVSQGLSEREASDMLFPINKRIKTATGMRLMENRLHVLVRRLQKRGVTVMGLTARHPDLGAITIRQLYGQWMDFTLSLPPGHENLKGFRVPGLNNQFLWLGGIAFTDGSPKGPVLEAVLKQTAFRPGRVIAIDDRMAHVQTLMAALLNMGIPGTVVHYGKAALEHFDPAVADLQMETFKKSRVIISDESARLRLQTGCEEFLSPAG